ncbi:hypothetical protein KFK09_010164 [Dendrobium nobile]|uniref:Uncharacterized protein n=1 Tax=Dendrobium nobile TaxID=94219 RepID=A0A8T3BJU7_DENNO|nr:hypothetical protein KFK09_010164 [Dendrobium nobile]
MTESSRRGVGDGARTLDTPWELHDNLNQRLDEISTDLFRLSMDMRREFQAIRAEMDGTRLHRRADRYEAVLT